MTPIMDFKATVSTPHEPSRTNPKVVVFGMSKTDQHDSGVRHVKYKNHIYIYKFIDSQA